jgi:glycosyltransferase involved in cell wall biosynthesis
MSGFEENEISKNSNGGTEITKRSIAARIDPALADNFQIIASRIRELEEDKIRIYWLHDLPEDPEASHLKDASSRDRFHRMVFSSNWQYQQYMAKLGYPETIKSMVIETPFQPIEYVEKSKDEIRLVYFSTPHRGLQILVPVFKKLAKKYSNIHLDIFSSFKIYGWENADKPFEELFADCDAHPQITNHGSVPQEQLRAALQKAHIFAYPNIWQETSCRCLMESMSAGLFCVHPNYGALSDTSGGLTAMYQMDTDPNIHANIFMQQLDNAIQIVHQEDVQNYLKYVKFYADNRFNIDKITTQWQRLMEGLIAEYPTVESRKQQKQMFRYKV